MKWIWALCGHEEFLPSETEEKKIRAGMFFFWGGDMPPIKKGGESIFEEIFRFWQQNFKKFWATKGGNDGTRERQNAGMTEWGNDRMQILPRSYPKTWLYSELLSWEGRVYGFSALKGKKWLWIPCVEGNEREGFMSEESSFRHPPPPWYKQQGCLRAGWWDRTFFRFCWFVD